MVIVLYSTVPASAMEYFKGDQNFPICKYEIEYNYDLGTYANVYFAVLSSARQSENKIFVDIANVRIYQNGDYQMYGRYIEEMLIEGEHRIRVRNLVFDPDSDWGADEGLFAESYRDLFWEIDEKIGIRRTGFTADKYAAELHTLHAMYLQPFYYTIKKTANGTVRTELDEARRLIIAGFLNNAVQNHQKAVAILDAVIKENPNNSEAYLLRGMAKTSLGDFGNADNDYEEALILEPENACFYYYRGLNHLVWVEAIDGGLLRYFGMEASVNRFSSIEKGEKMFDKALEIAPYYADVLFNEARLLEKRRDMKYNEKALANYNRLLSLGLKQDEINIVRSQKDALTKKMSADAQKKREEENRKQTLYRINN